MDVGPCEPKCFILTDLRKGIQLGLDLGEVTLFSRELSEGIVVKRDEVIILNVAHKSELDCVR